MNPAITWTTSLETSEGSGDLPAGVHESEEAGTGCEALAQAIMPLRSNTVRPPIASVGTAGSMREGRNASYAVTASSGIEDLKSGPAVFFCAAPERARDCVCGW
jgi:hypothetical protein